MKKIILLITSLISIIGAHAQDVHFSLYPQTPLLINPSNTGRLKGDQRVQLIYRDQWRSVAQAFRTYAFSFDMSLKKKSKSSNYFGVGISAFADRAGDIFSTNNFAIYTAYHIKINDNQSLSAGINAGITQQGINASNMQWGNQYNELNGGYNANLSSNETINSTSFISPDIGAGTTWSYSSSNATLSSNNAMKANIGFAVYHVNAPKLSYYGSTSERQSLRYNLNFRLRKGIKNTDIQLEPVGYAQLKRTSMEMLAGVNLRYLLKEESKYTGLIQGAAASIGVHYRVKDAIIATGLIEIGKFAAGISYDFNISKLRKASNTVGAFEIALRYVTPNPFNKKQSAARFM